MISRAYIQKFYISACCFTNKGSKVNCFSSTAIYLWQFSIRTPRSLKLSYVIFSILASGSVCDGSIGPNNIYCGGIFNPQPAAATATNGVVCGTFTSALNWISFTKIQMFSDCTPPFEVNVQTDAAVVNAQVVNRGVCLMYSQVTC